MKRPVPFLLAGLSGIMLGLVSYYCFYGWYDIFPWAIAALIVGYFSKSRRAA